MIRPPHVPEVIVRRFSRYMPPAVTLRASVPMPWQDEEGEWHDPPEDAIVLRVSSRSHVADAVIVSEDIGMTDEQFQQRILGPMLALLVEQSR